MSYEKERILEEPWGRHPLLTDCLICPQNKESIPFAVIGSNTVVEAKGKRVRGRLYPWGIVEGKTSSS